METTVMVPEFTTAVTLVALGRTPVYNQYTSYLARMIFLVMYQV